MQYSYCFGGDPVIKTLKVGGTIAAGTLPITETTHFGHLLPQTTTSLADCLGLALSAGTYAVATEATVSVIVNPLAVHRCRLYGGAATAALNTDTNTAASTTVLSAATIDAADMHPGMLYMLTGANAGLSRVVTAWVAATTVTTTVQFPANMAVGDIGLIVPFKTGTQGGTFTTALTELRQDIAYGTGATFTVVDVELERPINSANPVVYVDFIVNNHAFNPVD